MNQIRTKISFNENFHKQLLLAAVNMGVVLSDLDFFATISKKVGKTNWAKLVRGERDRDSN